ncbi:hypothetical protein [Aquabacter cavernae]|uniref:hypothetical protein n=1 Tax=Aquabacter cavernae TaxID=2496029 RepID=UPI000F8EB824|nr:hypothetical protein [Aquabacter cavernae]
MKVVIKDFHVELEVKNKGIEFQVNDNDGQLLGDVYLTRTGLIWAKGKSKRENGVAVTWEQFIEWMESE